MQRQRIHRPIEDEDFGQDYYIPGLTPQRPIEGMYKLGLGASFSGLSSGLYFASNLPIVSTVVGLSLGLVILSSVLLCCAALVTASFIFTNRHRFFSYCYPHPAEAIPRTLPISRSNSLP